MSFEFKRVDPHSVRDDVVNFFWEQQKWPATSIRDYYDIWDWRYTALSDGPPLVYIARLKATGKIIGHVGGYRRNFRIGSETLRICVPGNLLVDAEWQKNIIGARLVMFLRNLVESGEFDAVLAFGNPSADTMFVRLGFKTLGSMHTYVDIRDVSAFLRRRTHALSLLAPIFNAAFAARRKLSRAAPHRSGLRAVRLNGDEFMELDRSHWAPPDRLVAYDSGRYVVDRYLREPGAERYVHGIFKSESESLEAFVVTETAARIKVWDCQVNPATIDPPSAIAAVVAQWDRPEAVLVPTLPQSKLARDFVRSGFLDRESVDTTETTTFLSIYSLPSSPHAAVLGDPARWNLWLGSRHY